MKFLICFVVFASITIIGIHASPEDDEMIRSLAQDCKEKEGASDDDVEALINKKLPETKEGKCLIACMQIQFGMVEDGKLNKEGFTALAQMKVSEPAALEKVQKIADECESVTHADRCEFGYLLAKCLAEKAKEYGIDKEME